MPSLDAFLEELFPPAVQAGGLPPGMSGGDPRADALARLAGGLRDRAAMQNDGNIPLIDRDRQQATWDASASGDYAPGPGGGMSYRPWDPRAGAADDAELPSNATPNAGTAPPGMPIVNPPLPAPRPVGGGPSAADLLMGPGGAPPPMVAPQPGAPMGGGGLLSKLFGTQQQAPMSGGTPDGEGGGTDTSDQEYVLGRLLGLDNRGEKRLMAGMAGGLAGANPAFKGGAFAKGLSGSLAGGLKSDKEDEEATNTSDATEQKQKNFERTQTDKEATSAALRRLYGARADTAGQGGRGASNLYSYQPGEGTDETGETVDGAYKINRLTGEREFVPGMVLTGKGETSSVRERKDADSEATRALRAERAAALVRGDTRKVAELDEKIRRNTARIGLDEARTKNTGTGRSSAWQKPPEQRYNDAMRLIQNERKAISAALPLGANAADKAAAEQKVEAFKKRTLKAYGIDEDGNEASGAAAPAPARTARVPSSATVVGDREGESTGLYPRGDYDDPHRPTTREEFDAIPSGQMFVNPADNRIMTKK